MAKPHEVLGVDANADIATINAAFRREAKKYHPDLHGGEAAGVRKLRRQIGARDFLIEQQQKRVRFEQGRSLQFVAGRLRGRIIVPIAFASVCSFALVLLFAFDERGSTLAANTAEEATAFTQDLDVSPDAGSADFRAIRDWQEAAATAELSAPNEKKPEARHNLRRPPAPLEKAFNDATSLLKNLRRHVSRR